METFQPIIQSEPCVKFEDDIVESFTDCLSLDDNFDTQYTVDSFDSDLLDLFEKGDILEDIREYPFGKNQQCEEFSTGENEEKLPTETSGQTNENPITQLSSTQEEIFHSILVDVLKSNETQQQDREPKPETDEADKDALAVVIKDMREKIGPSHRVDVFLVNPTNNALNRNMWSEEQLKSLTKYDLAVRMDMLRLIPSWNTALNYSNSHKKSDMIDKLVSVKVGDYVKAVLERPYGDLNVVQAKGYIYKPSQYSEVIDQIPNILPQKYDILESGNVDILTKSLIDSLAPKFIKDNMDVLKDSLCIPDGRCLSWVKNRPFSKVLDSSVIVDVYTSTFGIPNIPDDETFKGIMFHLHLLFCKELINHTIARNLSIFNEFPFIHLKNSSLSIDEYVQEVSPIFFMADVSEDMYYRSGNNSILVLNDINTDENIFRAMYLLLRVIGNDMLRHSDVHYIREKARLLAPPLLIRAMY